MYNEIRELFLKNEKLFETIRFLYTPVRVTREFFARRKMANRIIGLYGSLGKDDKKIFYFGIPEHNNLGDMAQTYCTRKWLSDNFPEYRVIEVRTRASFDKKFLDFVNSSIGGNDLFVFQSGYCTRTKNPDHLMHLNIMKNFPDQKAVIFPQTVRLGSKKDIEKTRLIFNGCKHLLFITRDHISYENAKEFISEERLALFPDIVTSLIGYNKKEYSKQGALLCVRNDGEKYYSDAEIEQCKMQLSKFAGTVDITDTNSDMDVWATYERLGDILEKKIDKFGCHKVVITDRYHGTIFSLIANTPVIVIKTNDHKVTSGVGWFDGVYDQKSVQLAGNLMEAVEIAKNIIENNTVVSNGSYFNDNYYTEKLNSIIETI